MEKKRLACVDRNCGTWPVRQGEGRTGSRVEGRLALSSLKRQELLWKGETAGENRAASSSTGCDLGARDA